MPLYDVLRQNGTITRIEALNPTLASQMVRSPGELIKSVSLVRTTTGIPVVPSVPTITPSATTRPTTTPTIPTAAAPTPPSAPTPTVKATINIPATATELKTITDAQAKGLCVGTMKSYYTIKTYQVGTADGKKIYVEAMSDTAAKQKAQAAGYRVSSIVRYFGFPTKTTTAETPTSTAKTDTVEIKDEMGGTMLIPKDQFNALPVKYQNIALTTGWRAMDTAMYRDNQEFKTNNVELKDGKWISKEDFAQLETFDTKYGTNYTKIAQTEGFTALQSALAKSPAAAGPKLGKYESTDPTTGDKLYDLPTALKDGAISQADAEAMFGSQSTKDAMVAGNMLKLLDQDSGLRQILGTVGSIYGAGGAYMPKFVTDNSSAPEAQLYLKLLYQHDQQVNAKAPVWKKILGLTGISGVRVEPQTIFTIRGTVANPRAGMYLPPPVGGTIDIGGIGASAVPLKDVLRGLLRKPITAVTEIKTPKIVPMAAQGWGERVGIWEGKLVRYFPQRGITPATKVASTLTAGEVSNFVEVNGLAGGMNRYGITAMQKVYGSRAWSGVIPTFSQTTILKSGIRSATKVIYKSPETGEIITTRAGNILKAASDGGLPYARQLYGDNAVASTLGTKIHTVFASIPPRPSKQMLDFALKLRLIKRSEYEQAIRGFAKQYGRTGTIMRYVSEQEDVGGHIIKLGPGEEVRMPWTMRPSNIISPEQYFAALVRTGLIKQIPGWRETMKYWPEVTTWYRPTAEVLKPMPEGPGGLGIKPSEPAARSGEWQQSMLRTLTQTKLSKQEFTNLLGQLAMVSTSTVAQPIPMTMPTIKTSTKRRGQPAPQRRPAPVVSPLPTPTPRPAPKPHVAPAPRPTPQPRPQPSPKPTPHPTPQPQPQPQPQPAPVPIPQPQPVPTPTPTPTPIPIPRPGGWVQIPRMSMEQSKPSKGKMVRKGPALAVWKQGRYWVSIFPPFRTTGKQEDVVYSLERPPWGSVIAKGRHAPKRTLRSMGKVPELIVVPMGVVTARIRNGRNLSFSRRGFRRRGRVITG